MKSGMNNFEGSTFFSNCDFIQICFQKYSDSYSYFKKGFPDFCVVISLHNIFYSAAWIFMLSSLFQGKKSFSFL